MHARRLAEMISTQMSKVETSVGSSSSAGGMTIPVLSLAYEAQAYLKLGRLERAEMLREAASRATQDVEP
jgi:hypothetical protein